MICVWLGSNPGYHCCQFEMLTTCLSGVYTLKII